MSCRVTPLKQVFCLIVLLIATFTFSLQAEELKMLAVGYPVALIDHLNKAIIPAFAAEHGVKVTIDSGTWNNRMDKILVSIAGGVPYDIVATGFYSPWEEGASGLLAPLDPYLSRWEHTAKFPPPLWNACRWQGKTYVVPQDSAIRGIAYNKGLFAEAGIDPNAPPQSWEEWLRYSRMLTRVQGNQVAVRGWANSSTESGSAQELFWFMRQAGITEINIDNFTSNLNQPQARQAIDFMADLADVNQFLTPGLSGGFAAGRVAMEWEFPAMQQRAFAANPDLINQYGLFLPRISPGATPVAHGFINGLAILQASQKKDIAWKFIATLYERDTLEQIEQISGFLSGRMDLVSRQIRTKPKIDLFYNSFTYMQSSVIPPPRNTAQNQLGQLIQQVYKKRISPREAIERAHEMWTLLLVEWRASLK